MATAFTHARLGGPVGAAAPERLPRVRRATPKRLPRVRRATPKRLPRARRAAAGALLALALACAPSGPGREATGAGRPVPGWIELAIDDRHVPADPLGDPGAQMGPPPPCALELELGGSRVLQRELAPVGDAPPYAVRETLRVPAAPGSWRGMLAYSGCRSAWGQLDSREVDVVLEVRSGQVTRLEFDGATLLAWPPAPR